jgi:hypothetical protein
MASTHLSLNYHLIFSTKDRAPIIHLEWKDPLPGRNFFSNGKPVADAHRLMSSAPQGRKKKRLSLTLRTKKLRCPNPQPDHSINRAFRTAILIV